MSRLQELIAELCPDGVEYKALGEVCTFNRGQTITKKNSVEGPIPVVSGGTEPAYYVSESNRTGETVTVAGSGAGAGFVSYWNEPIWCGDSFSVDVKEGISITPRFLYAYLKANEDYIRNKKQGAGVPHVHGKQLKNMRIPVPPIEVQREVVRVLDEYTAAHDELVKRLEEEIELRKQSDVQSFQRYLDEWIDASSEIMMLRELVLPNRKISYGIVQPGEGGTGDLGVIRPIDIKNSRINVGGIKYVDRSKEDGYQRTKLQGGEILVVVRGTTGEIAVAPDECRGMNVTRGIAVIATNDSVVDRDYLFDFLRGESAQRYIANNTRGTALRQINIADLEKLKIPVLQDSLREEFAEARSEAQSMTDAHHGLIDKLSTEISLENQQLSLVRNQLLSFPEKVA